MRLNRWTPQYSARPGDHPHHGLKKADERTRTADPFITSEVLYQLSYVGSLRARGASGKEA